MLYRDICKILSVFFYALAAILAIPFFMAIYYQFLASSSAHPQPHTSEAFFFSILCTLAAAGICHYIGGKFRGKLYLREGIALVVIVWLATPALSALPFLFSGVLKNPLHAYFEMVAGYTTTGSSVIQAKKYDSEGKEIPYTVTVSGVIPTTYTFYGNVEPVRDPATGKILHEGVEAIGKALLFWRCLTNWIGGIGIIVLFILILPILGVGGKMLYMTESPGPIKDALTPRIKETAWVLLKIYIVFSLVQLVILVLTNSEMSLFDAFALSLSTLASGGFSIKNLNIASYNNIHTEMIIMVFMVLGSINFGLYYYAFKGKFYRFYDTEFIIFCLMLVSSCLLVSWLLVGTPQAPLTGEVNGVYSWSEALRYGSFQTLSIISSAGYSTANFDRWPYSVQTIMLLLMYVGGMSGSTCGGIKLIRLYMLFRIALYKIESIFRPHAVRHFRVGTHEIDDKTAGYVLGFFFILISVSVICTFLHILDGIDPETAIGSVACLINNVGVGFRMAGPMETFAFMSDASLMLGCAQMVLGRLEFYAILAMCVPAFWKQG